MFTSTRNISLALFALLISGVLFFQNYRVLVSEIEELGVLVRDIPLGFKNTQISQGDKCVGNFDVLLEEGKLMKLLSHLNLDLQLGKNKGPVVARVEGYFNPIGQLVAGVLDFEFQGRKLKLNSEGVNPIEFSLLVDGIGGGGRQTLSVPGPISIVPSEDGSRYKLKYPHFKTLGVGKFSNIEGMLTSLGLEFSDREKCKVEVALDVRGVLRILKLSGILPEEVSNTLRIGN